MHSLPHRCHHVHVHTHTCGCHCPGTELGGGQFYGPLIALARSLSLTLGVEGWLQFPMTTFTAIPVITGAFAAHYNAPRYYMELSERSLARVCVVQLLVVLLLMLMLLLPLLLLPPTRRLPLRPLSTPSR